jgi:hypothetical protein
MNTSDHLGIRLDRCDRHIADLTDRIRSTKQNSEGTGFLDAETLIELLQQTLESWLEIKEGLSGTGRL